MPNQPKKVLEQPAGIYNVAWLKGSAKPAKYKVLKQPAERYFREKERSANEGEMEHGNHVVFGSINIIGHWI